MYNVLSLQAGMHILARDRQAENGVKGEDLLTGSLRARSRVAAPSSSHPSSAEQTKTFPACSLHVFSSE